jgi:hypothetical protein
MNSELEKMWNESVVVNIKSLSKHFLGGTEEDNEKPSS